MSDPLNELDQVKSALDLARDAAVSYLGNIGEAPVLDGGADKTIDSWQDPVPEEGDGSLATLTDLAARAEQSATRSSGPRLPSPDDPHPNPGFMAPENSRRARALAVWATLRAYGRVGHREMVQRHLDLAQHLADRIDQHPVLERLADVDLNIVCFRACPSRLTEAELNDFNSGLGADLLQDGRVFAGTTNYGGRTAFRPAIVNWRTRQEDVDMLVEVLLELIEARLAF